MKNITKFEKMITQKLVKKTETNLCCGGRVCVLVFWNVLVCFNVFSSVLVCFGVVLVCFGVLVCFWFVFGVLEC